MKTGLLVVIALLLAAIAFFMYQENQKTPAERAAEDIGEAVEGVVKSVEDVAKEIEGKQ